MDRRLSMASSTSSRGNNHDILGSSSASSFAGSCTKWRILQWAVVIGLVVGVAVGTHIIISRQEEDDFERMFQRTADQVHLDMQDGILNAAALLQTFSLSVASSTPVGDWPYVTIPFYDDLVKNYQSQSNAAAVVFAPLVSNPTEWERYAAAGQEHQSVVDFTNYVFKVEHGVRVQEFGLVDGYMAPAWQIAPQNNTLSPRSAVNYNLYQTPWLRDLLQVAEQERQSTISHIFSAEDGNDLGLFPPLQQLPQSPDAWSVLAQPIFTPENDNRLVGFLLSLVPWGPALFADHSASPQEESILCVLKEEETGKSFTYRVEGAEFSYLGSGDSWTELEGYGDGVSTGNEGIFRRQLQPTQEGVPVPPFTIEVYPTEEFHDSYTSNNPAIYTTLVVTLLVFVALVFAVFEFLHYREIREENQLNDELNGMNRSMTRQMSTRSLVGRRTKDSNGLPENNKQLLNIFLADQKRSHDLVGELSGSMLDNTSGHHTTLGSEHSTGLLSNNSLHSTTMRNSTKADANNLPCWRQTKAVADLFPAASVLFADISGFTAWSSVREPSQAFSLLENIYDAFDQLATRRRIFKVETIGDCYTAVCGLPERRADHAVALCYFAKGCLRRFRNLTHKLEETLGPETSELALRIGINSGPIMAGILRASSSARFQLFGETVTMASKIEGAGKPGRIHLSKETAAQLTEQGKGHWLQRREDKISTTKGELQTFWLLVDGESQQQSANPTRALRRLESDGTDDSFADDASGWEFRERQEQAPNNRHRDISEEEVNSKMLRLVGWNCEIMIPLLKMIVARRAAENKRRKSALAGYSPPAVSKLEGEIGCHNNVLDEVEEVISLPHYDAKVQKKIKSNPDTVQLGDKVEGQLREYVYAIAKLYHPNPFHSFEHASHVTMSTMKLLSRIVAPEEVIDSSPGKKKKDVASALHDYTYGITSDPLTQFAVILAALIHDVDHRGVPNNILCQEEKELAAVYDNKSVAEQNSVDVAWELFMDPRFEALRQCVYASEAELKRFRLLLVNCVMSTDIFDKKLSALRKARWEKAFSVPDDHANAEDINRKATIVIEHLIQASDVSHTMQHWHVYQKWNERLFHEMYMAYRLGRSDKDPSAGWYKGEIWFYDNYVIPLAKKLSQCGVFGVSSDEYLTYAVNNRNEWEEKGQQIVADMIDKYSVMMDVEAESPSKKKLTIRR